MDFSSVFWGITDIIYWKSIWDGVDCLFGKNYTTASLTLSGGLLVLISAKSLKSASSLPVGMVIDDVANCCSASTFLQTKIKDGKIQRGFDAFFTFMIELFVILAWHGLWSIQDLTSDLYGFSHEKTAWISYGIGTLTNVVIFCLQFPIANYVDNKRSGFCGDLLAHILAYFLNFLCFFSAQNTFRGYWYLLDEYLMPSNYENSLINGFFYGVLVLFAFHCGCSLHAGIFSDLSEEKGGNIIEYYFSSYFFIKVSFFI